MSKSKQGPLRDDKKLSKRGSKHALKKTEDGKKNINKKTCVLETK